MLEISSMPDEKLRNQVSSRFADHEYAVLEALEKELDRSESYIVRMLVMEALRTRRLLSRPSAPDPPQKPRSDEMPTRKRESR